VPRRLGRYQLVRPGPQLFEPLLEPLAVLDQGLPLILEPLDHPLEILAERLFAGRTDPRRAGSPQPLDMLLQLLRAIAVALQLRLRLLAPLDPFGMPRL